jgi:hypothetical protein
MISAYFVAKYAMTQRRAISDDETGQTIHAFAKSKWIFDYNLLPVAWQSRNRAIAAEFYDDSNRRRRFDGKREFCPQAR